MDLLFTPDDHLLLSAGMDNVINMWKIPEWSLKTTLTGHIH
jgi:WD40 repeat protein